MNQVPMNLRRLVADVLPKGFEVAKTGEDSPACGYAYFHVLDPAKRRRAKSQGTHEVTPIGLQPFRAQGILPSK